MHAAATESLLSRITPSEQNPAPRVLDIGSGSGYLTHIIAELIGDKGLVVGVEHIRELRDMGENNMAKSEDGSRFLQSGRVKFRLGDGRKGWTEPTSEAGEESQDFPGWDAIHVGASAKVIHQELLDQLRSPGR